MASIDWMLKAAEEIYNGGEHGEHNDTSPGVIRNVIAKHAPRCSACKHWKPYPPKAYSRTAGECQIITMYFERGRKQLGTAEDFGCVRWEEKDA